MAEKSSGATRADSESPRRRRTRKVAPENQAASEQEPQSQETGEQASPERPASRRAAARTAEPDDSDFAAGIDLDDNDQNRKSDQVRKSSSPASSSPASSSDGQESLGESGENADGDSGDSGDSGDEPKRRRRRRRRRSRGAQQEGGSAPPQAQSNRQSQNGQNGQGARSQRGRRQPNRGQNSPGGGGRGESSVVIGVTEGILEMHPKGYGFLRDPNNNYAAMKNDTFVSGSLLEKHKLREGILIRGEVTAGVKGQGPRLKTIESIDGRTLDEYQQLTPFDQLTAINPFEQIKLETGSAPVTMRVMDLLTPIGKGQRALIVAPPRTGKTMLLQEIANSVSTNHPEVHLMVLLIDERPEEVTEMRRQIRGEVIASSMDRDVESHTRIAQLIVERGKRIAEAGGEAFILLDSITRTARAFNKVSSSGRTGTGGLDIRALDVPKKLFGTARRFDEGGSLTVVATALIETGSRMDDIIFQEFKGTGNMELVLNRGLSDRRIWPAIDIQQSGTRREEMILSKETLDGVTLLRRSLISLNPIEAMEQLTKTLARFPSNAEFLAKIRSIM